jgi:hypothetical protein
LRMATTAAATWAPLPSVTDPVTPPLTCCACIVDRAAAAHTNTNRVAILRIDRDSSGSSLIVRTLSESAISAELQFGYFTGVPLTRNRCAVVIRWAVSAEMLSVR